MRAVNLIPQDSGQGGGGVGSGSGTGVYVLLGVLALLVASVAAFVLTNNQVVERRAEAATLQAQVRAAQAQAQAMRPYTEFATLAQARVQTVRQLGESRFDWHRALSELSKVVPDDVWLTSLLGTVTTGVSVEGAASGGTGSLRGALPNPAIELTGCTTSHEGVGRLISRLRLMDGVERVALADSSKQESSSGGSGDCRNGHKDFPQFGLVVFFAPLPAVPAPPATVAGATAPVASTSTPPATPPATGVSSNSAGSDLR